MAKKISLDRSNQRTVLSKDDIETIEQVFLQKKVLKGTSVVVELDQINEDYSFSPAHYFPPEISFYDYDHRVYQQETDRIKREIKHILSEHHGIDELNIAVKTTRNKYEQLAEMIFDHWFVRFEHQNSKTETVYNEKLKTEIPVGWGVKNIQEVCNVIDCLHSKKPEYCREDDSCYLLTLENITTDGYIDLSNKFYVSRRDYEKWTQRTEVTEGDFVVTNAGRAGCIARIPAGVHCGIARNLTAIKPNSIGSLYMRQYLRSYWFKRQIATSLDEGSFFLSFNVKSIKRIDVLIPPETVMEEFEKIMQQILGAMPICDADPYLEWLKQ